MKKVILGVALSLVSTMAYANTILVTPTPTITGSGPYTWAYPVVLDGQSQVNTGDFFSIFDFSGLIAGSQNAPAGWTPSSANVGPCPAQPPFPALCAVADNASVANITWTRTGAAITNPGANPVLLGIFGAMSISNIPINDFFVSQDEDLQTGTVNEGAGGNTNVPLATVPEPTTLMLMGSVLSFGAGFMRRRLIS